MSEISNFKKAFAQEYLKDFYKLIGRKQFILTKKWLFSSCGPMDFVKSRVD